MALYEPCGNDRETWTLTGVLRLATEKRSSSHELRITE